MVISVILHHPPKDHSHRHTKLDFGGGIPAMKKNEYKYKKATSSQDAEFEQLAKMWPVCN